MCSRRYVILENRAGSSFVSLVDVADRPRSFALSNVLYQHPVVEDKNDIVVPT